MSNERLSDALATALEMAINSMDAAAGFLAGELPDVIEQLLMWKLAEAGVAFGICLLTIICFGLCWRWYVRKSVKDHCFDGDGGFALFGGACTILFVTPSVMFGVSSAFTALQILIAPKVYLIEYAAQLAR